MKKFTDYLKKIFSSSNEASSKRFIAVCLAFVYVISFFLLMYIKIQIANRDLVANAQEDIFYLILAFGGFITAEKLFEHLTKKAEAKKGTPTNEVNVGTIETVETENLHLKKDLQ